MDEPQSTEHEAIVCAFLQMYAQDQARGDERSVADYQARFPGYETRIAAEYAALQDDIAIADEAPLPPKDLDAQLASTQRFRVDAEIGRGGMGTVYRVWDQSMERALAMKVLPQGEREASTVVSRDPHALARFLQEARITGQLEHPGIVPVHQMGLDEKGRVYFTMSLVRGDDFQVIIDHVRNGTSNWNMARALGVVLRICEAMAFAHDKGIVHRDLKPKNIMVGRFGETYVMDWGLARVLRDSDQPRAAGEPEDKEMTSAGDVFGTPAYMPPEQARGEMDDVGKRSDVYSIGAILYHLLAGRAPFFSPDGTETSHDVLDRLLHGGPTPIRTLAPDTPSELVAICEKAMARTAEARYANCLDLAADLGAFLEQRVVAAYETGAWAELRKWLVRNRGLAAASAIAILALIAGTIVSLALMARADEHADRAIDALRAGEVEQGRLIARTGLFVSAERTLWREYFASRSTHSLWALEELYQAHPCLAARDTAARINGIAFGPDDAWAVAGGRDGNLLVVDPQTLRVRAALTTDDAAEIHSVAASRGLAATANEDGTIGVWDVVAKKLVHRIPDAADGTKGDRNFAVAFAPDHSLLASANREGVIHFWNTETWSKVRSVRAAKYIPQICQLRFSPDGQWLAASGADAVTRLYSVRDGTQFDLSDPVQIKGSPYDTHQWYVICLAFTPDGRRLLTGGSDHKLRIWDLEQRRLIRTIKPHAGTLRAIEFSPDGKTLAVACQFRLELRDAESLEVRVEVATHASTVAFSADGQRLFTGHFGGAIALWEVHNMATRRFGAHEGVVAAVTDPTGTLLATGDSAGRVRLFDLATGTLRRELKTAQSDGSSRAHRARIRTLTFSPDGTRIATGSKDGLARIWDVASGACQRTVQDHDSSTRTSLAFDKTGDRFYMAGKNGAFWSFATTNGSRLSTIEATAYQSIGLAWHPNAARFATISREPVIRLWNPDGTPITVMGDPKAFWQPWSLAQDSSSDDLAVGDWNGDVRVYDTRLGRQVANLPGHAGLVTGLAYRPGAPRYLASCSVDGTIRLWDREADRCVLVLEDFPSNVLSVAWGRDGRTLIAAGGAPEVVVWDLAHLERRVAGNLHRQLERYRRDVGEVADAAALRSWADSVLDR